MYNALVWFVGIGFIVFVIWSCLSFLRWIFGMGKPRNEFQWDNAHLCQQCQQPTVVMQFNPAFRVCYGQCGYWRLDGVEAEWHSFDPAIPKTPDYYFHRN